MRSLAEVIGMIAGDPSCVLCLPMTPDSIQNGKVLDMSRYGNHGTVIGCVPGQVPILGDELLVNGGFETLGAGGADVFGTWVEGVSGTSEVLSTPSVYIEGANACRMNIDASNNVAQVYQLVNVEAGQEYLFRGWYCGANSPTLYVLIRRNDVATRHWNFTTKAWQDGEVYSSKTALWAWSVFDHTITAEETATLLIKLCRNSAASKSLYFDNISFRKVLGYRASGLYFDGVNDVIDCGGNASVLPDAFTLLAWVAPQSNYAPIASFHATATGIQVCNTASSTLFQPLLSMGTDNYQYHSVGTYKDIEGRWQHHAITLLGTAQTDVQSSQWYSNGVLRSRGASAVTSAQSAKANLYLGKGASGYYKGHMAFVTLHNRVLTKPEIVSHYNLTRPFIGV